MDGSIRVIPEGTLPDLSGSDAEALERLGQATWWRVPGRDRSRCRVVTTLLHGNEPSGFRAIRGWMGALNGSLNERRPIVQGASLPAVDLCFFVSAVEAALGPPLFAHRVRPGGRDQNRSFLPEDLENPDSGPECRRAESLMTLIEEAQPEALIDLHNNTGHNPAYGVGTCTDSTTLGLTALFADRFMHSDLRLGTLMEALEGRLPCTVIECGRAGDPVADATALAGLDRFATLEDLAHVAAHAPGVEVLTNPVRVEVKSASLTFDSEPSSAAPLTVRRDIDQHNFKSMQAGELIGWIDANEPWPVSATGASGSDISNQLFERVGNQLRLLRAIVPVMMTTSPEIAKSDCLFYALERRS